MSNAEQYISIVPDWATSKEVIVHDPENDNAIIEYEPEANFETLFVLAVATTPNGQSPPFLDVAMTVEGPEFLNEPGTDGSTYFSNDRQLLIVNTPYNGKWYVCASGDVTPFALNFLAFHPAVRPNSPSSLGLSGNSPFKCTACKSTAKALSLSIVAAATLPTLPKALIGAVATYLGASIAIAAAFISSVIGDTASVISEKLCEKVGLC